MDATTLLLLLVLFQVKHLLADYVFQSSWMVESKGRYGHVGGLAHSAVHGLLSLPVLFMAPLSIGAVAAIAVAETVLHYHIDWTKAAVGRRLDLTPAKKGYWVAMGADQFVHQITYAGILGVIAYLAA